MKNLLLGLSIIMVCLCITPAVVNAQDNIAQSLPDEAELSQRVTTILDYLDVYDKNDYEIIFGVYNYICQVVEYDWAATGNFPWDGESLGYGQTAYEALCEEKAVCAGIAKAVTLLLNRMDIPCNTETLVFT